VKFTHVCILAVATALSVLGGETSAFALRATPAFQPRDSRKPGAVRPAPFAAAQELNHFQKARLGQLSDHTTRLVLPGSPDTLRVAVFQVQFTDSLMGGQPGSNRKAVRDSTWFANELGHMSQYFRGASRQHFEFAPTLDGTLYTVAHKMSYYGADSDEDTRVVDLAAEVIAKVDGQVDFSQFDHVLIIHAGAGQETDVGADSPNQIWSSFYDRSDIRRAQKDPNSKGIATNDTRDGQPLFIDNFSIVPSDASQDFATVGTLGIWCFQIGSRIGLVPLFDSTGGPDSEGIGNFDLMSYGLFDVNGYVPAFPCAFNRVLMGWVDPVTVDAGASAQTVNLKDINTATDADTVCLKVPITESEYYLVDNRVHDANADSLFTFTDNDSDLIPDNKDSLAGAEFDFFLTDLTNPATKHKDPRYPIYNDSGGVLFRYPGSGMYVWHVDEQVIRDAVTQGFLPDDFVGRKGVDLEEADGVQDMDAPGPAAFALGSYFDAYRAEPKGRSVFGPKTKPASISNSGVSTGLNISTSSPRGLSMRVSVKRDLSYSDVRTRWNAASPGQCATPVDLDNDGTDEIVVLSDSAGVFVFKTDGSEWKDLDANPKTIAPFIAVPGIKWAGPPAFGNLDAAADIEIIAAATTGELYAWKANGTELVDGDNNAGTTGILHKGLPLVTGPMLLDVNGGAPEVVIAEKQPDVVRISLIDATGVMVSPASALLSTQWPNAIPGQRVAPLAEMRIKDNTTTTIGVAVAALDTTSSRMSFTWVPAAFTGSVPTEAPMVVTTGLGHVSGANRINSLPSAPAVGDIDGDGDDEAVLTTPAGTVFTLDIASAFSHDVLLQSDNLRAANPSSPVLGDVDGDGTLEIAVWDEANMYLLKSNARPLINWPRPIRPESAGEAPPRSIARAFESPLMVNLKGSGPDDVLFPLDDGTVMAFDAQGSGFSDFPRVAPSGAGAAPSLLNHGGVTALVFLGSAGTMSSNNSVIDSVGVARETVLSIQELQRSPAASYWPMSRADLARTGRITRTPPAVTARPGAFDDASFIIYPNPVHESTVHARVDTNARATVALSILNLEGQEAVTRSFSVNPNGLPNTPFDEAIDVGALKSGVYLMRLRIESSAGSGSLVKTFAIRR
jgi:M6 family metalloprotease-like protein